MVWATASIADITQIISGGTPKSGVLEYWGGDVKWITPKDMGMMTNLYVSDTSRKISQIGLNQSSAKVIPENSVILSTRAPIGYLAINTVPMATNQGCRGLVPKKDLDSKYLYYFLLGNIDLLNDLGSGTTFKELSKGALEKIKVPLAPLLEQKRIVAILDQAFADIEQVRAKTEQNLKNARELMSVTFHEAITGKLTRLWRDAHKNVVTASELIALLKAQKKKLVSEKTISKEKLLPMLSKEEVPYELPESWIWCRLGEIGNAISYSFVDGPFGSSINTKTDYLETGVPVLRMANVKPFIFKNYNLKYVNEDKFQQFTRHNVLPGDVLFSKVGAGTGESCVVPEDFSYGMLSTTGITRIRVGQVVLNQYLCCFLNSNIKNFMTLASKAAQPFLNMTQIKTFPFPLPPIEEQNEIILILERLSTEIQQVETIYEQKILALDELKKSILQKAFAGELSKSIA